MQYNTIQYNTIRVYCENTLSYNNGVLSQTEPKSGSVKARQLQAQAEDKNAEFSPLALGLLDGRSENTIAIQAVKHSNRSP